MVKAPAARRFPYALAITFAAVAALGSFAAYVDSLDLMLALGDTKANLNLARFTIDSLTPGISQIGVWNPLVHVALIPAVTIWPLFQTGWAGFFTLLPFFCLTCVSSWRMCATLTGRPAVSLLAPAVLMTNPFLLYYGSSPMAELLLIGLTCFGVDYFLRWWKDDDMKWLMYAGVAFAFASTARFEGLMLLPTSGAIVFLRMLYLRAPWMKIVSALLLYYCVASLGFVFILAYGWFYTGNPLYFASDELVVISDNTSFMRGFSSTSKRLGSVVLAMQFMFGIPMLSMFAAAAVSIPLLYRKAGAAIAVVSGLLLSPLVFVLVAVLTDKRVLYVPPYHPYFVNDRYVLTLATTIAIVVALAIARIVPRRLSLRSAPAAALSLACVAVVLAAGGMHLYKVAIADSFEQIRRNIAFEKTETDRMFPRVYDYGYVLATHFNNEGFIFSSGLPLRRFVYESNYRYYEQVSREPWLFARWVVIVGGSFIRTAFGGDIVEDEAFRYFYDLQYEQSLQDIQYRRVYKLNETRLRNHARSLGIDERLIPSLNTDTKPWVLDVYRKLLEARGL